MGRVRARHVEPFSLRFPNSNIGRTNDVDFSAIKTTEPATLTSNRHTAQVLPNDTKK